MLTKTNTMSKKNILLSLLLSLIFVVTGFLNLHKLINSWILYLNVLISLIIVYVLIARNVKKENGGYASFGSLVKHFTIAIIIATTIGVVANIIQVSLLDSTQKETIINRSIETTIDIYSKMGFNDEQLATLEDTLEKKMSDVLKPGNQILSAFYQFLFYFLVSLIPAAILKKNPPNTLE